MGNKATDGCWQCARTIDDLRERLAAAEKDAETRLRQLNRAIELADAEKARADAASHDAVVMTERYRAEKARADAAEKGRDRAEEVLTASRQNVLDLIRERDDWKERVACNYPEQVARTESAEARADKAEAELRELRDAYELEAMVKFSEMCAAWVAKGGT